MSRRRELSRAAVVALALTLAQPSLPALAAQDAGAATAAPAPAAAAGTTLYLKLCSQCHGEQGDGQGIAATRLQPRPRDFTAGKFKIRHTPSGALPTDDDLRHIIRVGMPSTSMPAWPQLSDAQIEELVTAVKSFSPDFANPERQPAALEIPKAPFTRAVGLPRARAHWVRPEIVVQVAFIEWTVHDKLRHPRLLGIRTDKSAREVVRERA